MKAKKFRLRYKNMLLNPNFSDNIYMELSMNNLNKFYLKAIKELNDIRLFFNIYSES